MAIKVRHLSGIFALVCVSSVTLCSGCPDSVLRRDELGTQSHHFETSWAGLTEVKSMGTTRQGLHVKGWKSAPSEFKCELWKPTESDNYDQSIVDLWRNEPWHMVILHHDNDSDGKVDTMVFASGSGRYSYRDYDLDGCLDVMELLGKKHTYILWEGQWLKTIDYLRVPSQDPTYKTNAVLDGKSVDMIFQAGRWELVD